MNGGAWHKVNLQQYGETRTASGHPTKTWSTYASGVWMQFRTLSGNERQRAQQVNTVLTHEVTMTFSASIVPQPDHRILWGTRIFDIKDVRNVDERNVELRLLATEVLAAGPVSSESPSASASASPSASSSSTPSSSPSASASASPSASASASISGSPSASGSASPSSSGSSSPSASPSQSASASPSSSVSQSPSASPSGSKSSSASPTPSESPSTSLSPSPSQSPSASASA